MGAPVAFYAAAYLALFPQYRYLIGPDGISYISMARHYLAGQWREALNVHWGPLYAWLLSIPMSAHVGGLAASKMVCFVAGLATLLGFLALLRRFELSPMMEALAAWIAAVMILAFALLRVEPDLILAALLVFYFGLILDGRYPEGWRRGAWCGLLGALAYLTKSYGLIFFVGHFTVANAVHWWRSAPVARRGVVRNFAIGIGVLAAVSGPWIAAVSHKYGRWTLSTTGDYNYRLVGPRSNGYPQYLHLLEPPETHAISYWEEPAPASLPAWSPLTGSGLRHQLKLVKNNFKDLIDQWDQASIFSVAILLAYCVWGMSTPGTQVPWYLAAITILIYPAGYLLVLVQDRYLWATTLLTLLLGAVVVQAAVGKLSPAGRRVLLTAFAASYLVLPLRMLVGQRHADQPAFEISRRIQDRFPVHGNVAACGNWNESLYLAYYLDLRFLGDTGYLPEEEAIAHALNPSLTAPPPRVSDAEATAELRARDVDYYLGWESCPSIPGPVLEHPEITQGGLPGLRIYSLK